MTTNDDVTVTLSRTALNKALETLDYALFEEDGHLNPAETAHANADLEGSEVPFLYDSEVEGLTAVLDAWRAMCDALNDPSDEVIALYHNTLARIKSFPSSPDE